MVINEKCILARMKEAHKGKGYTVIRRPDGKWIIRTDRWVTVFNGQENVPNEVLSLIVLHTGELPKVESAARIYKAKTGSMIQQEVYALADEEIQNMVGKTIVAAMHPKFALRTKLQLGACHVWQKEDLEILLMDPEETAMIAKKENIIVAGNWLYAEGVSSQIWAHRVTGIANDAHLNHLAAMQWVEI